MVRGKAEDAGGLTPAKDDNAALCHFDHRTLPILKCVGYKKAGIFWTLRKGAFMISPLIYVKVWMAGTLEKR